MAKEITIGIAKIILQELDSAGADVGTPFSLGDTLRDTFTITADAGTPAEVFVDEQVNAILSKNVAGTVSMTWQSPNADPLDIAKVTGGTWDATEEEYSGPISPANKDFRVTIIPEQGWTRVYNRVSLTGEDDGVQGTNNQLNLTVTGNVLTPVDGKAPYVKKKQA